MNDTEQNLIRNIDNNKESYLKEEYYSNPKYNEHCISNKNYKLYNDNNNINTSKFNNSLPNKKNNFLHYDNTLENTLSKLNNNNFVYYDNTKKNNISSISEKNIDNIKKINNEEKNNIIQVNNNNNNTFYNKEEIEIIEPNRIIENKNMNNLKAMNSSSNKINDDKIIDIPKNIIEKKDNQKRKNFDCCYCYGPKYKFKNCICCNPNKKYCCFIVFLAYLWYFSIFLLMGLGAFLLCLFLWFLGLRFVY